MWLQRHRQGALIAGVNGVLLAPLLAQATEMTPEGMVPAWRVGGLLDLEFQDDGGLLLTLEEGRSIRVGPEAMTVVEDVPYLSESWLAEQGLPIADNTFEGTVAAPDPVPLSELPGVVEVIPHPDGSVRVLMEDGSVVPLAADTITWVEGAPHVGQAGLEMLGLWPAADTPWTLQDLDPTHVALGVMGAVAAIASISSGSSSTPLAPVVPPDAPDPLPPLTADDDTATIISRMDAAEPGTVIVNATGMTPAQLNAIADRIDKVATDGLDGTLNLSSSQSADQLDALLGDALADTATVNVDAQGMNAAQRRVLADNIDSLNGVNNLSLDAGDSVVAMDLLLGSDAVADGSATVNATDMDAAQLNLVADNLAKLAIDGLTGKLLLTQAQNPAQMQSLLSRVDAATEVTVDAAGMGFEQLEAVEAALVQVDAIVNLGLTTANSTSALIRALLDSEVVADGSVTVDAEGMGLGRLQAVADHLDKVEAINNLSLTQTNSTVDLITNLLGSDVVADGSVTVNTTGMPAARLDAIQTHFAKVADITVGTGQTLSLEMEDLAAGARVAGAGTLSLSGTLSAAQLTPEALAALNVEIARVDIRAADLAPDVTILTLPGGTTLLLTAAQMEQLSAGEGLIGADEATTVIIDVTGLDLLADPPAELLVSMVLGGGDDRLVFDFGDDAPAGAAVALRTGSLIDFGGGDNTIEALGGAVSLAEATLTVDEAAGGTLIRFNINSALTLSVEQFQGLLSLLDAEQFSSLAGAGSLRVIGEADPAMPIDLQEAFGDNFQPGGLRPPTLEFTDFTQGDVDAGRLVLPVAGSTVRVLLGEAAVEGFDQEVVFSADITVFNWSQLETLVEAIRAQQPGSEIITGIVLGNTVTIRQDLSLQDLGNVATLDTGEYHLWVNENVALELPLALADGVRVTGAGTVELTAARGVLTADLSEITVENLSLNVGEGDAFDLTGADLGDTLRLGVEAGGKLIVTAAQADGRYMEVDPGGVLEIRDLGAEERDLTQIQAGPDAMVTAYLADDMVTLAPGTLLGVADVSLAPGQTLVLRAGQASSRDIVGEAGTAVVLSSLGSGRVDLDLSGVAVETFTTQITANTTLSSGSVLGSLTLTVAAGQALSLTASQADAREIQGGTVTVRELSQTPEADLSAMTGSLRLALADDTEVTFTGRLPETGRVRVDGDGSVLDLRQVDSLGEGGLSVASGTTVVIEFAQIPDAGILGEGTVRITGLERALDADLSQLTTGTVTAELDATDNPQFSGNLGAALVTVSGGVLSLAAGADIANASFIIQADAALLLSAEQTLSQLEGLLGQQTNPDATLLVNAQGMNAAQRQVLADNIGSLDSVSHLSLASTDTALTITTLLGSDAAVDGSATVNATGMTSAQLNAVADAIAKVAAAGLGGTLILSSSQSAGQLDALLGDALADTATVNVDAQGMNAAQRQALADNVAGVDSLSNLSLEVADSVRAINALLGSNAVADGSVSVQVDPSDLIPAQINALRQFIGKVAPVDRPPLEAIQILTADDSVASIIEVLDLRQSGEAIVRADGMDTAQLGAVTDRIDKVAVGGLVGTLSVTLASIGLLDILLGDALADAATVNVNAQGMNATQRQTLVDNIDRFDGLSNLSLEAADTALTITTLLGSAAAADGSAMVNATGMTSAQLNAVADAIAKLAPAGLGGTLNLSSTQSAGQLDALLGNALADAAIVNVDAQGMNAAQRQVLADNIGSLDSVSHLSLASTDTALTITALLGSEAVAAGSATVNATGMTSAQLNAVADAIAKLAPAGLGGTLNLSSTQSAGQLDALLGDALADTATVNVNAQGMNAAQRQVLADNIGSLDSVSHLSLASTDTALTITALLGSDAVDPRSVAVDTTGLADDQLAALRTYLDKIDLNLVTGTQPLVQVINETQNTGFMDLGEAIASAEAGDVLRLASGEYIGDIRIDKPLTLIGPNQTPIPRDEEGKPLPDLQDDVREHPEAWINGKITIAAPDVTLDGLRLHHANGPLTWDTGILSGDGLDNFTLSNSYVTGYVGDKAPSFMGGSYDGPPVATGWTLSGNLFGGVVGGVGGALYLGGLEASSITDNVFWRPAAGHLYLSSLQDVEISGNAFYHGLHAGGANFDGLAEFFEEGSGYGYARPPGYGTPNGYGGEDDDVLFFGRNFWMEFKGQNDDVRIIDNQGAYNSGGLQLFGEGETPYRFDNFLIQGNEFVDFVNADPMGILGAGRAQSGFNGVIVVSLNEGHSAENLVIIDNIIDVAVDQIYSIRDIVSLVEIRGHLEGLTLQENKLYWSESTSWVQQGLAELGAPASTYEGVIQGVALSGGLQGTVSFIDNEFVTEWVDSTGTIQQLGLDIRRELIDGYGEFQAVVTVPAGNNFTGWDADVVIRGFLEGQLDLTLGADIGLVEVPPIMMSMISMMSMSTDSDAAQGGTFMAFLDSELQTEDAGQLWIQGDDGQAYLLDLSGGDTTQAGSFDTQPICLEGPCLWHDVPTQPEVL
ncbi:hypothetical protein [Ectothiorhodospira shaposhnikovii]|uniref:hypothetical protein n=1 Tax=Ectothiorhodospira shaposhnikovii TaxID=1054 RepID=UPI001EE961F3|nr:hypothetical protein [Ectothiorhodospira shaposhnikovii]MCG5514351.1 hypothetical protein [Ectothiorhodospira shaposhnikovii]